MRTAGDSGGRVSVWALFGVTLAVLVAGAGLPMGVASAQSTQAGTPVDSCTTIDTPGRYVLTGDVTGESSGPDDDCIEITASDVVLDGAGHTLSGNGEGHGVGVNGSSASVTNVTVERLRADNWSIGVFYLGADNSTISGTVVDNNTEGIALGAASNNTLTNNTAYNNAIAVATGGQSQNNTLRDNVAVENKWGIHFERESGNNTITDNVARNNSRWDYYSEYDESTNTVTDLELSTTTVSFTEQNVALRSVTSPPPLPRGTRSLGTFVETTRTRGGESALSLTMRYDEQASATLWQAEGSSWSQVPGRRTVVDGASNSVTVNTSANFGIFAPLADANGGRGGGAVTVSADRSPPVQRTLTAVESATTTRQTAAASDTPTGDDSVESTPGAVEPATTQPARGESDAASGFVPGLDAVRLLFAFLGLVALAGLGLAAMRQTR